MMNSRIASLACAAVVGGLALAGCGTPKKTPSAPVKATGAACTPAKLHTHASRVLTVATDSPAYPPYFEAQQPEER
jgi:polar amino acid transport system substrate-binding protein